MSEKYDLHRKHIALLIGEIRLSMQQVPDPHEFLQSLQCEIEQEPGARVSFVTRALTDIQDVLEEYEVDPQLEDPQSTLYAASLEFCGEDMVSDEVNRAIDVCFDRLDINEEEPEV